MLYTPLQFLCEAMLLVEVVVVDDDGHGSVLWSHKLNFLSCKIPRYYMQNSLNLLCTPQDMQVYSPGQKHVTHFLFLREWLFLAYVPLLWK
jgi:hypothetical protein